MTKPSHAQDMMAALEGRSAERALALGDDVRASWQRSASEHHLEPDHVGEPNVLTQSELLDRLAPVEELCSLSTPEISRLLQRLREHAQVLMLSDPTGATIVFRSSAESVDRCSSLRIVPGSVWTEESQGTNGVGLCLREQRPITVLMSEHFATKLSDVSCTAAPIFGANGQLVAVLNMSAMHCSDRVAQILIRDMVASSARRIENLFFDRRHSRGNILRLSRHDDFCDGAAEARLALDDTGRIIDATPTAHHLLLGKTRPSDQSGLLGQKLSTLAGVASVERLLQDPKAHIVGVDGRVHLRGFESGRKATASTIGSTTGRGRTLVQPRSAAPVSGERPRVSLTLDEIVGRDTSMQDSLRIAQRLHARSIPLLLQGESGSGKTQLARALHEAGPHQAGGFVAINCAAIPQELIESELFGYRAGAFTGAAKEGSPGRLIAADHGTLFLDEIGDMPLSLQGRLLQVLSEGEFVPVGAVEPVRVHFALVSASLRDLRNLVREGRFREDLYYRLSGASITVPPLRSRNDRQDLIQRAFDRAAREAGIVDEVVLTPQASRALAEHGWPGNLRELQHAARFAIALNDSAVIELESLPPPMNRPGESSRLKGQSGGARRDADEAAVIEALTRNGWNVSAAANALGVSRATLHRRVNEFKLERPGPIDSPSED